MTAHGKTGCPRSFPIRAKRVDGLAEYRVLQQEPGCQQHTKQQHRRGQHARNGIPDQELAERRRDLAAWLVHHQQGHTLQDEHGGKGHHDRLQAQNRDEKAVERAGNCADGQPAENP